MEWAAISVFLLVSLVGFGVAKLFDAQPKKIKKSKTNHPKTEPEPELPIEENLDDEFIFDKETGQLLTVEQATSGQWPGSISDPVSEEYLLKYYAPEERGPVRVMNHLKVNDHYSVVHIPPELDTVLEGLEMFIQPQSWHHHSNSFTFNDGKALVLFPVITYESGTRPYLVFAYKMPPNMGHYVFRKQNLAERIFDKIVQDDDIRLDGYECFTIKNAKDVDALGSYLAVFSGDTNLEIEVTNGYLFVRGRNSPDLDEFNRLKALMDKVPSNY